MLPPHAGRWVEDVRRATDAGVSASTRDASPYITLRGMRIAWFCFGLIFVAYGVDRLLGGDTAFGVVQAATGVVWLLLAVLKRRSRFVGQIETLADARGKQR
jgi:hypothetical protein